MMTALRKIIFLFAGFNTSFCYALPADNNALGQGELLRVILGLGLVLILILGLSRVLKRLNATHLATGKGFKSIGTMVLGPKEKMLLIQVGERFLLIGATAGSINLLCDFGEKLPEGFDGETKPSFSALLKSASGKG